MENTANRITLRGSLAGMPAFSHENHGRKFYRFDLEVERLSGTADILPVLAPEDVLLAADLFGGSRIEVEGQIRSFNSRTGVGRKLVISVYAERMTTTDREAENSAFLEGAVCKEPIYRKTPLGREICDVMLAVARPYRRADYIPCILWGRAAQDAAALPVGARLALEGRLQSRQYVKVLPTGNETRTAYELSVTAVCPPEDAPSPEP
jgi:single-strand DNA-binding protein